MSLLLIEVTISLRTSTSLGFSRSIGLTGLLRFALLLGFAVLLKLCCFLHHHHTIGVLLKPLVWVNPLCFDVGAIMDIQKQGQH